MARVNRLKGMLFSHEKDWESAIEFFEKSKREFEAMNALPELIQTLYEYGSTYLQRNQEGDREKAHSLLDQALEISRKIGANREDNSEKETARSLKLQAYESEEK